MRTPRVRRAMVAAATVVGLAVSTGCGSDSDSGSSSGSDGGVTTLTFGRLDLRRPGRGPHLQEWLDAFNASQDEIRVEAASVPYPTFGQTVLTQMGGGEGPDLVRFDMPEFEAAADAGLITPLDDLIDVGEYELLEQPDRFMVHDDVRHGIIFEASNYAMFYNADLIPNRRRPTTTSSPRHSR